MKEKTTPFIIGILLSVIVVIIIILANPITFDIPKNQLTTFERELCTKNAPGFEGKEDIEVSKCILQDQTIYSKFTDTSTRTDSATNTYFNQQGNQLCAHNTFFEPTKCQEQLEFVQDCTWIMICGNL